MDIVLNDIDARVLGCLIEKERATPDYYPLTLHSLTAACNQKSSRSPAMSLAETDVVRAIDRLRAEHLCCEAHLAGSRVPKYEHSVTNRWKLQDREIAVLCVLLLRGPQTPGEVRSRTTRLYQFRDVLEVNETFQSLVDHPQGPFVLEMPRLPGHKENRYSHLLCGEPEIGQTDITLAPEAATLQYRAENERLEALEKELEDVQAQVAELKAQFEEFVRQFE